MASFRKIGGRWQAQVARRGVRKSKLFDTKIEAKDWAAREEYLILKGEGKYGPGTLGDLFDRYAREVSPKKRGARWEQIRLELFQKSDLAKVYAREAKPEDFAKWRDARLRDVSASTVRREMILMSAVMTQARKEWGVFPVSPLEGVSKPQSAPPRERRVSDDEIARLVEVARDGLESRAVHAFRFAVETGMRAGEILSLKETNGRVADLPKTKNGDGRRVPLSSAAVGLWEEIGGEGFCMTSRQLDTSFRRVRDRAGIEGLTFHDSRHEAITRLSKKLDVLALAKVVGHRDIRQLMVYYAESPEELAARLD